MRCLPGARLMVLAVLLTIPLLLSCRSSGQPAVGESGAGAPPRKVTFMAGYRPQADLPFVAAYVAQEKGFFRDQNLQVDIQHSSGQDEHLQLLLGGRVEFTTGTAAQVIRRRNEGMPVVAVALFGQRGDQGFVALKESGLTSPKQWEGKTIGIKVLPTAEYLGVLQTQNIDRTRVREVPVPFDPRILCERRVDVIPVFLSNEPDLIRRQCGMEVTVWDPADYGVATLGLTYMTRNDLIQKDPDVVHRFVKATMRGLAYAQERPDEAVQIVMKYAEGADPQHMRFMMDTEFAAASTPQTRRNGLGWMTVDQWQALQDSLIGLGILQGTSDPRSMFDDRFLRDAYRDGRLDP